MDKTPEVYSPCLKVSNSIENDRGHDARSLYSEPTYGLFSLEDRLLVALEYWWRKGGC